MAEKKITLEQLIRKKLDKDEKKAATKEIYIESLGGYITFTAPSDAQRIEYSDKTKSGSYVDMISAMERVIYDCCPLLHSKELLEGIGVDYPYDSVKAIFDVDEIADIGLKLIRFFEPDEEEEEEKEDKLKN